MGLELGSGRCALDGLWQAARLVRLAAAADPYQWQGVLWRTAPPWMRSPWSGVHPITRMSICLRTLPWIVEGSKHGYLLAISGQKLSAALERRPGGALLMGQPCEQTRGPLEGCMGFVCAGSAVSKDPWSMPPHQPCQQLGEVTPVAWGCGSRGIGDVGRASRSSVGP